MEQVTRHFLAAATFAALLFTGACGGQEGSADGQTLPVETLSVVTDKGSFDFDVEIADDEAERARGLMFRPPLEDDKGMLFQFPDAAERAFWMQNTPSSLDIVYLDNQGCIISIAAHTTPYAETTYPSNGPARGVLEVRAGRMAEIGAGPGDRVRHPFFDTQSPCS